MKGITSKVENLITYQERTCSMALISRLSFVYSFFFLNLNMQIVQRSHFFFLEFRVLFLPVMWKPLPSFPYLVSVLMPFVIATAASQLFAILSSARSIGKDRFFYAASCLCR